MATLAERGRALARRLPHDPWFDDDLTVDLLLDRIAALEEVEIAAASLVREVNEASECPFCQTTNDHASECAAGVLYEALAALVPANTAAAPQPVRENET